MINRLQNINMMLKYCQRPYGWEEQIDGSAAIYTNDVYIFTPRSSDIPLNTSNLVIEGYEKFSCGNKHQYPYTKDIDVYKYLFKKPIIGGVLHTHMPSSVLVTKHSIKDLFILPKDYYESVSEGISIPIVKNLEDLDPIYDIIDRHSNKGSFLIQNHGMFIWGQYFRDVLLLLKTYEQVFEIYLRSTLYTR